MFYNREEPLRHEVREKPIRSCSLVLRDSSVWAEHDSCRNHTAASIELGAELQEKQSWASDQRNSYAGRSSCIPVRNSRWHQSDRPYTRCDPSNRCERSENLFRVRHNRDFKAESANNRE